MRTVEFSFSDGTLTPTAPQYAGIQGEHNATEVCITLPEEWVEAEYTVRAEFVDGAGAFDTTDFLTPEEGTVTVSLPFCWTAAGGLGELRLAAATPGEEGLPEDIVAYSPVAYLYFSSRSGEPASFRDFPGRGLSALIADCHRAASAADEAAEEVTERLEAGELDGATWYFGTAVSGTGAAISAHVADSKVGDAYFNTAAYTVYEQTAEDTWKYLGCLKGAKGDTGATGATGQDGVGVIQVKFVHPRLDSYSNVFYEVYTTLDTLPTEFLLYVYLHYGIGEASPWGLGIYDDNGVLLWSSEDSEFDGYDTPAGYHLFAGSAGEVKRVRGDKGDKGDPGEPGTPGTPGAGVTQTVLFEDESGASASYSTPVFTADLSQYDHLVVTTTRATFTVRGHGSDWSGSQLVTAGGGVFTMNTLILGTSSDNNVYLYDCKEHQWIGMSATPTGTSAKLFKVVGVKYE